MRIARIDQTKLVNLTTDNSTAIPIDVDLLDSVIYESEIDTDNPKSFPKVIKAIKSIVRASPEYKNMVTFIKENHDMNRSFFFKGIKNGKDWNKRDYTIEAHHTPFVMEDIVVSVITKRIANGESLKFLKIAEEILYLHYIGAVGLAPLSKTEHALIHNENTPEVFIPLQFVPFGDFNEFFEEYRKYIPDNVKIAYSYMQDLSLKYEKISDIFPNYLKPKCLYYEGFLQLHKFEDLVNELAL